jgi:hypothetical protein
MHLDWHPAVRLMEPPPSDWGLGIGRSRLVCDHQIHIEVTLPRPLSEADDHS